jgi:hypothetical protein
VKVKSHTEIGHGIDIGFTKKFEGHLQIANEFVLLECIGSNDGITLVIELVPFDSDDKFYRRVDQHVEVAC